MVLLRIWRHVHVRVPLHHNSFPSFLSGWTIYRWIRRRFAQTWLSIIVMTCRHSIECTTFRDFLLEHVLLGRIELKWVSDCLKGSSRHSWTQPPRIWTKLFCNRSHLPNWCARQRRWEHTSNSGWQNACGVGHGKETKKSHGRSFHKSRTADIYTNQTGFTQWRYSKNWLWRHTERSNKDKIFDGILLKEWNLIFPI